MINVNHYTTATDSEAFEQAIADLQSDRILIVPQRQSDAGPERTFWLLDRAILLPENITVILQNCTIKLSDRCRDNFFRTANCGMGIEYPQRIRNIHILGIGTCTLLGADHPRATGDESKQLANPCPYETDDLCAMADWIPPERRTPDTINFWDRHNHSYGTDAGTTESQYGDWRGIGILFANTEHFSIKNLQISDSHGWGISLESCSDGTIEQIHFDACMSKMIDGLRNNMENQDGIDLRNGCHNILISDITGKTGDDVIALTAIASETYRPGGAVQNTHVMHSDWTQREKDIHDIIIRNVQAYSDLCYTIRLLPANAKIWNIIIDNVIDTAPNDHPHAATIILGDGGYGKNPIDGMSGITISNIICNSNIGIEVSEYLRDSIISNVINKKIGAPLLVVRKENGLHNVKTDCLVQAE